MKSSVTAAMAFALGAHANVIRLESPHLEAIKPRQDSSCENTATSRECWGDYSVDTDYYKIVPDTGVTREYWLSVENVTCAPDGYERTCMTFNGTVPGPTIIADWGDTLKIHVTNNLENNGTAIHWHGLRQQNSTEYDGVPGVTQCPISPGGELTYEYKVTQYGSTWYHSHLSLQYAEGLYGGMIINGPATADYDEDLGLLFLSDWSHTEAFALWDTAKAGGPPTMENGLINGTNTYDCSGSDDARCLGTGVKYETTFESGKKYRFRVVNVATDGHFQFSIDNHNLTVIGNDLVPINPYTTDAISVSIGQRYDVIVEANQPSGDYWLRGGWVTNCGSNGNAQNINGIIRYDSSSTADPTTNSTVTTSQTCGDEPVESLVPRLALDVGTILDVAYEQVATSFGGPWFQWTINGSSLDLDWENPTVLQMLNNQTSFPTDYNVISVARTSAEPATPEWVVLVIEDDTGFGITHPIHLHGHDFWILEQETGAFTGDTSTFNLNNPPRRDVASLPGNGHLAIAFQLDNPGAWIVHCHIAWHASEGLALEFVEDQGMYSIGQADQTIFEDQCSTWNAYMNSTTYAEFGKDDSGI